VAMVATAFEAFATKGMGQRGKAAASVSVSRSGAAELGCGTRFSSIKYEITCCW